MANLENIKPSNLRTSQKTKKTNRKHMKPTIKKFAILASCSLTITQAESSYKNTLKQKFIKNQDLKRQSEQIFQGVITEKVDNLIYYENDYDIDTTAYDPNYDPLEYDQGEFDDLVFLPGYKDESKVLTENLEMSHGDYRVIFLDVALGEVISVSNRAQFMSF